MRAPTIRSRQEILDQIRALVDQYNALPPIAWEEPSAEQSAKVVKAARTNLAMHNCTSRAIYRLLTQLMQHDLDSRGS